MIDGAGGDGPDAFDAAAVADTTLLATATTAAGFIGEEGDGDVSTVI